VLPGLAKSSISWHSKRPHLLPTQKQQQQQQPSQLQQHQHQQWNSFSQPAPLGLDHHSTAAFVSPPAAAAAPVAAAVGGEWNTRQTGARQHAQQLQQATISAAWPSLQPSSNTVGGGRSDWPSNGDALWGGDGGEGAGAAHYSTSSLGCYPTTQQQQQWPGAGLGQLLQGYQQQQWAGGGNPGFEGQHSNDQQQGPSWCEAGAELQQQELGDVEQGDEQGPEGGGDHSDEVEQDEDEAEEQQQQQEEEEVQLEMADFDLSRCVC
jgi:hypothetical protein